MNQTHSLEENVLWRVPCRGREWVQRFLLAGALLVTSQAFAAFDGAPGLRNVVIPIYTDRQSSPAAVLRVRRVSEGHQKKGFFRIGVLPTVVFEDTGLEIHEGADFSNVLHQAHAELASRPDIKRAIDGRGFSITFRAHTNSWVQARRMSLGNPGIWRLEDVTIGNPGSSPLAFRRAALQLTGPLAGELRGEARAQKTSIQLPIIDGNVTLKPLPDYEARLPLGMPSHFR